MKKNKRRNIGLLVILGIFLLAQLFFIPRNYINSKIAAILTAPFNFFGNVLKGGDKAELDALKLENQSLQSELANIKVRPEIILEDEKKYVRAFVYSNYPFNNDDRILINVGQDAGLKEGMAVLVAPGIFLGEIDLVGKNTAEVRTIFSPGWELPVRIGEEKVDSLLVGGYAPRLTLISKNKEIASEEFVYLVDKRHLFGLVLGRVGSINDSDQELFEEATLVPLYNRAEIKSVLVLF